MDRPANRKAIGAALVPSATLKLACERMMRIGE